MPLSKEREARARQPVKRFADEISPAAAPQPKRSTKTGYAALCPPPRMHPQPLPPAALHTGRPRIVAQGGTSAELPERASAPRLAPFGS